MFSKKSELTKKLCRKRNAKSRY